MAEKSPRGTRRVSTLSKLCVHRPCWAVPGLAPYTRRRAVLPASDFFFCEFFLLTISSFPQPRCFLFFFLLHPLPSTLSLLLSLLCVSISQLKHRTIASISISTYLPSPPPKLTDAAVWVPYFQSTSTDILSGLFTSRAVGFKILHILWALWDIYIPRGFHIRSVAYLCRSLWA